MTTNVSVSEREQIIETLKSMNILVAKSTNHEVKENGVAIKCINCNEQLCTDSLDSIISNKEFTVFDSLELDEFNKLYTTYRIYSPTQIHPIKKVSIDKGLVTFSFDEDSRMLLEYNDCKLTSAQIFDEKGRLIKTIIYGKTTSILIYLYDDKYNDSENLTIKNIIEDMSKFVDINSGYDIFITTCVSKHKFTMSISNNYVTSCNIKIEHDSVHEQNVRHQYRLDCADKKYPLSQLLEKGDSDLYNYSTIANDADVKTTTHFNQSGKMKVQVVDVNMIKDGQNVICTTITDYDKDGIIDGKPLVSYEPLNNKTITVDGEGESLLTMMTSYKVIKDYTETTVEVSDYKGRCKLYIYNTKENSREIYTTIKYAYLV